MQTRRSGTMMTMATPPESTKISLRQRLHAHAQQHWPQVASLDFHYRGAFAYVDAHLPNGEVLPLLRLRYGGSATTGASACTWPAATATKTNSCPADSPAAPPKKPSTAPAASTSATQSDHPT